MSENTDYAELEKKYQAVVAENVALKTAIEFATAPDMWEEHGNLLEYKYLDWYVDELNKALDGTPATTQAINEIKAQGVDAFVDFCKQRAAVRAYNFFTDAGGTADEFAASLRGGE